MTDDLVKRLRADELPEDRQYQREARVTLWGERQEAADRIEQLEAALRAVIDWDNTLVVEDGPFLGDVMNIVRKALQGKDE